MHSFIHAFTSPRIAGAAQFQRNVCSNCAALALCSQAWLVFYRSPSLFSLLRQKMFFTLFSAECCSPFFSTPFADSISLELGRKMRISENSIIKELFFFYFKLKCCCSSYPSIQYIIIFSFKL